MLSQSALRVHSTTTTATIIAHKSLPVDPLAAILAQVRAYLKQLEMKHLQGGDCHQLLGKSAVAAWQRWLELEAAGGTLEERGGCGPAR